MAATEKYRFKTKVAYYIVSDLPKLDVVALLGFEEAYELLRRSRK